jgi:hypothetical protein
MHPVPWRRLAAEHIEAMTAAAGTPSWSPRSAGGEGRILVSLSEIADSVPPAGRSGVPTGIASCTEGEGNAHATGNR